MTTRLERISNGDERAVRELLDEYGDLVWRLAHRYLDRADVDIDDSIQDVFVEIWLSAKKYDSSKGSEAAFVATIAHRRLIDHQRATTARRRRVKKHSQEARDVGQVLQPIRQLVHRHLAVEIASRFDELPDDERQALWLSLHKGLTHRQISEATDSPLGTVKSRLRRGLIRLTKTLRPEENSQSGTKEGVM